MIRYTIEDCLELLVGIQDSESDTFVVKNEDYAILTSIARQVFKGTGLTDRQYELIKTKLVSYKHMFSHDLTKSFNTLRIPLRELNREKSITITSKDDELLIAVRFIFNKKLLSNIEKVKSEADRHSYDSTSKIHYFPFNERNVLCVVQHFKNSNFDIQQELLTYFDKVEKMNNNKEEHIPGIYSFNLKNLSDKAINFMVSSIGKPSKENLAIYNDRKDQLGLHYFEQEELENSLNALTVLSKKIVTRKLYTVLISPEKYPIERVMESLLELNRFPLLVILPTVLQQNDKSLDGLIAVHNSLTNIFFNEDISVLFRVDNDTGRTFNEYIKTNKLNNPIDSNTKVVYINTNKFPKPLLKSNWIPSAVLTIGSHRMNTKVNDYISPMDLIIHYDTDITPFTRIKADKI
jgi:hypothetical protein